MARPRTSAKLPRKGKRGRPRIYDRTIARRGRTNAQDEYAELVRQIGDGIDARELAALFDQEIPDWRNGKWTAKLKLLHRELKRRGL